MMMGVMKRTGREFHYFGVRVDMPTLWVFSAGNHAD